MQQRPLMEARLGSQQEPDGDSLRQTARPIARQKPTPYCTDEDNEAQRGAVACCGHTAKPGLSSYTWRQVECLAACGRKYRVRLNRGSEGTGMALRKGSNGVWWLLCSEMCWAGEADSTARSWLNGGCPGRPESLKAGAGKLGPVWNTTSHGARALRDPLMNPHCH